MQPQAAAFERALALHCAPALAGAAPANLVSLSLREYPDFSRLLQFYGKQLEQVGAQLFPLCQCHRRVLLLVFRPALLAKALSPAPVVRCLTHCGYPSCGGIRPLLAELRRRVAAGDGFPHEIGLFLGYPLADVLGFMALGGDSCRLCGYWKVYGDVTYARECFRRFDQCRNLLCCGLQSGQSLLQLLNGTIQKAA